MPRHNSWYETPQITEDKQRLDLIVSTVCIQIQSRMVHGWILSVGLYWPGNIFVSKNWEYVTLLCFIWQVLFSGNFRGRYSPRDYSFCHSVQCRFESISQKIWICIVLLSKLQFHSLAILYFIEYFRIYLINRVGMEHGTHEPMKILFNSC